MFISQNISNETEFLNEYYTTVQRKVEVKLIAKLSELQKRKRSRQKELQEIEIYFTMFMKSKIRFS